MNLITEVQIRFIKPKDGLIGFASLVLNNELYLGSIGIHEKLDGSGYRLTYPSKLVNGLSLPTFHPIRKEIGVAVEQAIFKKLKNVMSLANDRHDCTDD